MTMSKSRIFLSIALAVFLMTVIFSGPDAIAEEGTCYLKATNKDVFVMVYDMDRDGNQGAQIWQGRIHQGQTARVRSAHAYVRYFYNSAPDIDQPFRGGVDKVCDDSDTVDVP
jgi:hypothetical protein